MEQESISEPQGFNELSKLEKVRYLQRLWDHIAEDPGDVPVPESHLLVAEQRLAAYRNDPSQARSAHDVLDRLAKKSR